jgi:hypothetical protein
MYALEISSVGDHVFGPLSDLGTPVWNLLLIPLLLTFYPLLKVTLFGRAIVAAIGTALMIVDVAPFGVSTGISVASYLLLTVWLLTLARRWSSMGVAISLVRLSMLIAYAGLVGAAVAGSSLAFGWGTAPQVAIMIIGLVPGVAAYASWPAWFTLLGRNLRPSSTRRLS